jgi:cytochrome P450
LKPFDLQGLLPQARKICMEMDQFFDKIIHDHMNEKHADGSKDLVDVLLSLPPMEDSADRLDNNKIKAMLVVMFTLPHVDSISKKLSTYLHIKE